MRTPRQPSTEPKSEVQAAAAPPLLVSVKLERFKAAFKPKAIPLRPFNVIIGRNGAGKSTLLEALQWIDTTLRRDAVAACERYRGVQDLINLRASKERPSFRIGCEWQPAKGGRFVYDVGVAVDADGTTPVIQAESLTQRKGALPGFISEPDAADRLALARLSNGPTGAVREFWRRAVFLRLSPSSLAEGSLPKRTTYAPILDEEGRLLPALLTELGDEERRELVERVQEVLPGMRRVEVSKPAPGRSEPVHYELIEAMKYAGRAGQKEFPIPAWMLSEGTRRLTALFALLVRRPAPTFLCIEELENGLDPWAVRIVLRHLRDASERGIQIIATTHSPWVLDEVALDDILLVRRGNGNSEYERFAAMPEVMAFSPSIPAGTRYAQLTDADVDDR